MTKEDIKYIEDYLEWVRQNMNPAQVDFEHFANGMMNCNNILSQALSLHNVVGQSEQLPNSHCGYDRNKCVKQSACKYPNCDT